MRAVKKRRDPQLKRTPEEIELYYAAIPGMAHFRGSGPDGNICRTCANLTKGASKAKSRCRKFKEITGYFGPDLPTDTLSACKYYKDKLMKN